MTSYVLACLFVSHKASSNILPHVWNMLQHVFLWAVGASESLFEGYGMLFTCRSLWDDLAIYFILCLSMYSSVL